MLSPTDPGTIESPYTLVHNDDRDSIGIRFVSYGISRSAVYRDLSHSIEINCKLYA